MWQTGRDRDRALKVIFLEAMAHPELQGCVVEDDYQAIKRTDQKQLLEQILYRCIHTDTNLKETYRKQDLKKVQNGLPI